MMNGVASSKLQRTPGRCAPWVVCAVALAVGVVGVLAGTACHAPPNQRSQPASPYGTAQSGTLARGDAPASSADGTASDASAWQTTESSHAAPPRQRVAGSSSVARSRGAETPSRPHVDREQFRRLARLVPATVLDGRDMRAPYTVVRRFLRAVMRNDAEGWHHAVHLESPLVLGPLRFQGSGDHVAADAAGTRGRSLVASSSGYDGNDPSASVTVEPSSFSVWRARLGRFRGIAGFGVSDWETPEIAVFLQPAQSEGETTVLRLRPDPRPPEGTAGAASDWDGTQHEARSWRVFWVERTFEPDAFVPEASWVVRRLDEAESQRSWRQPEALTQPALEATQLHGWFADVLAHARSQRLDGVRARTLSDAERAATAAPAARLLPASPAMRMSQEALVQRLARILQAPLSLEALILLDQHQLAGSMSVFVRTLVVLGEPHQMRQAYRVDWRLAQGLYKIAHIEAVTITPQLEQRLATQSNSTQSH